MLPHFSHNEHWCASRCWCSPTRRSSPTFGGKNHQVLPKWNKKLFCCNSEIKPHKIAVHINGSISLYPRDQQLTLKLWWIVSIGFFFAKHLDIYTHMLAQTQFLVIPGALASKIITLTPLTDVQLFIYRKWITRKCRTLWGRAWASGKWAWHWICYKQDSLPSRHQR